MKFAFAAVYGIFDDALLADFEGIDEDLESRSFLQAQNEKTLNKVFIFFISALYKLKMPFADFFNTFYRIFIGCKYVNKITKNTKSLLIVDNSINDFLISLVGSNVKFKFLIKRLYSFNKFKKIENLKVALVDTVEFTENEIYKGFVKQFLEPLQKIGAEITTYSLADAKKYGFKYSAYPISENAFNKRMSLCEKTYTKSEKNNYDITLLTGMPANSSRSNKIKGLIEFCEKNNIKLGLYANVWELNEETTEKERSNAEFIKQSNNIEPKNFELDFHPRIIDTNTVCCIPNNEYYISITILEAVLADKKILTDATVVQNEEWYNPELVRIVDFTNLNSKDAAWIKKTNKKYQNKDSVKLQIWLKKLGVNNE